MFSRDRPQMRFVEFLVCLNYIYKLSYGEIFKIHSVNGIKEGTIFKLEW